MTILRMQFYLKQTKIHTLSEKTKECIRTEQLSGKTYTNTTFSLKPLKRITYQKICYSLRKKDSL